MSFTAATASILVDGYQQDKTHYERQTQASTLLRLRR